MCDFKMLLQFEAKKLLSKRLLCVLTVITLMLTVWMLSGGAGYSKEYRAVEGMEWNRENFSEICALAQQQDDGNPDLYVYLTQPQWYVQCIKLNDTLTYDDYLDFRRSWVEGNYRDMRMTDRERDYWDRVGRDTDTPVLGYAGGWIVMQAALHKLTALYLLLIAFALCPSFAGEYACRTDGLLHSARFGKRHLFAAKLLTGIGFAAAAGLLFALFIIAVCGLQYGLGGFGIPVQVRVIESMYPLSIGSFTLIAMGLMILAGMMNAALVMLLSEATRSSLPPLAVVFATILFTVVIQVEGGTRTFQQFMSCLPVLRCGEMSLDDERLYFGMNALLFSSLLYFALTVIFTAICRECYRRYQVRGQ